MEFQTQGKENGIWDNRRSKQTTDWFQSMIQDHLIDSFYGNPERKNLVKTLEQQILHGQITVTQGVEQLFPKKAE